MLTLSGCLSEECNGVSFTDKTGPYGLTNLGGYGAPNEVTGPADFDTYELSIWKWDLDPSVDEPTVVIDLKLNVPTPDADGFYKYVFTPAQLNQTTIEAGVWYWEALGVKDGEEFPAHGMPVFTNALWEAAKPIIQANPPGSKCKSGCESPSKLFMDLLLLRCGAVCSAEDSRRSIAYMKTKLTQCC